MLDEHTQMWLNSRNRYKDSNLSLWCRKHCPEFDKTYGECFTSYDLLDCMNYIPTTRLDDPIEFESKVQKILLTWNEYEKCVLCHKFKLDRMTDLSCERSGIDCKLMWARLFAESGWKYCPDINEYYDMLKTCNIDKDKL